MNNTDIGVRCGNSENFFASIGTFDNPIFILTHKSAFPEQISINHPLQNRYERKAMHASDEPRIILKICVVLHLEGSCLQSAFHGRAPKPASPSIDICADQTIHTTGRHQDLHIDDA